MRLVPASFLSVVEKYILCVIFPQISQGVQMSSFLTAMNEDLAALRQ